MLPNFMGGIISSEFEINYIINKLNEKLDNIYETINFIKSFIITQNINNKENNESNIININIVMNEIDKDGFTWDDYEVRSIINEEESGEFEVK
jgi:hypothetical protein